MRVKWFMLLLGSTLLAPAEGRRILSTCAEVRSVPTMEETAELPVRVGGVVTYHEPEAGVTVIQEGTSGVFFAAGRAGDLPEDLRVGSRVEVTGVVRPGPFAPVVGRAGGGSPEVRITGVDELPEPWMPRLEELPGGAQDGRWTEMRGIIRAATAENYRGSETGLPTRRLRLILGTAAGRYTLVVPWREGGEVPSGLVDSEVRVRGVLGSIANLKRQWLGLLLYVPTLEHLEVISPAALDPFTVPARRIDEMLRFQPGGGSDRIRLRGEVTMIEAGSRLFVRTESGPIQVWTTQADPELSIGSEVEAVGHADIHVTRAVLRDAIYRVVGRGNPPQPREATVPEIMERVIDDELVRIEGTLFQDTMRGANRLLLVESHGQLVEVTYPSENRNPDGARVDRYQPGSELEIVGISNIRGVTVWDGSLKALDLGLILRQSSDVTVLSQPPWWSIQRLLWLLGGLGGLAMLILAWAITLRRRVAKQTMTIREQATREANERERMRIARNIHDDLGSRLTQLALLGERVKHAAPDQRTAELGGRISTTAARTVATMDEIVWAVNPTNDTLQGLADYLCQLAPAELVDAGIGCELEIPTVLPVAVLSAEVRHGLVMAVREALHNVVKHSKARNVRIEMEAATGELSIRVTDDGEGFDTVSVSPLRNGLRNLDSRLKEFGGSFRVESVTGRGTRVILSIPVSFDPPSRITQ